MKAIIVGSSGQDGTLLYQLLEKQDYLLVGLNKGNIKSNLSSYLTRTTNICNYGDVVSLLCAFRPDEIYHLAAFHNSAEDNKFDEMVLWEQSYQANIFSLLNFLEGIRRYSPCTRLFYAASSHVFGIPQHVPQNESIPLNPLSVYGITKAAGMFLCRSYRERHGVFASVGILYNHESIYRTEKFISAKIVNSAIRIKKLGHGRLIVGDLGASVDWGYAPDYVNAMQRILALQRYIRRFLQHTQFPLSMRDISPMVFRPYP